MLCWWLRFAAQGFKPGKVGFFYQKSPSYSNPSATIEISHFIQTAQPKIITFSRPSSNISHPSICQKITWFLYQNSNLIPQTKSLRSLAIANFVNTRKRDYRIQTCIVVSFLFAQHYNSSRSCIALHSHSLFLSKLSFAGEEENIKKQQILFMIRALEQNGCV